MEYISYPIKIYKTDGSFVENMPITMPRFTSGEYTDIYNAWVAAYGSGKVQILTGNREGKLTAEGKSLKTIFGLNYLNYPITTSILEDTPTEWLTAIQKAFKCVNNTYMPALKALDKSTSSGGGTYYTDLLISSDGGTTKNNASFYYPVPSVSVGSYKRSYLDLGLFSDSATFTLYSSYGSGTSAYDKDVMYFLSKWLFMVDNKYYQLQFDGYYNHDPQGLNGYLPKLTEYITDERLLTFFNYIPEPTDPTNPYNGGGTSTGNGTGGGGGTGTFDHGGTGNIDVPSLPTLSAVDAGFITLFVPTADQMQSLASYMWTSDFYTNIIKLFANPMDAIIGLAIIPVSVATNGAREVKVGNISTGVSMNVASSQYVAVDCGSISIPEYWGAALDYEPYSKFQIYLPYVGIRQLSTNDIMGRTVRVVYHVDILSGALACYVKCGTDVLYQFNGQCSANIPMSAQNFTSMIQSAISAVGAVTMGVASGGASAPMSAAMIGGAVNMGAGAANAAINSKPVVQHSGSMGGTGGMLAIQTPYLIVELPKQSMPAKLNHYEGYPSNITATLSDLSGFTMVEAIRLSSLSCTDDEKTELLKIMEEGFII